jgi:pimeloyl-ACP methyl ester carboxylesterase
LFYVEAGAGDPLILVMDLGADHLAWGCRSPPSPRAIASSRSTIAASDRADAPDIPYTTTMMADDTVGLIEALGIERAHVCGASMGGMIAQCWRSGCSRRRLPAPGRRDPDSRHAGAARSTALPDPRERRRRGHRRAAAVSHVIAQRAPEAELKTIADAGHAYMWAQPDAFNAMSLEFRARRG